MKNKKYRDYKIDINLQQFSLYKDLSKVLRKAEVKSDIEWMMSAPPYFHSVFYMIQW